MEKKQIYQRTHLCQLSFVRAGLGGNAKVSLVAAQGVHGQSIQTAHTGQAHRVHGIVRRVVVAIEIVHRTIVVQARLVLLALVPLAAGSNGLNDLLVMFANVIVVCTRIDHQLKLTLSNLRWRMEYT